MDEHLPEKTITKFNTAKPWVTDQFKDLITQRQRALTNNQAATSLEIELTDTLSDSGVTTTRARSRTSSSRSLVTDQWRKTKAFIGQSMSRGGEMEGMTVDLFDGNMDDLSAAINSFFHSVSSHLQPLCDSSSQNKWIYPTNTSYPKKKWWKSW